MNPFAPSASQGVWDELEMWHSNLAALEADIQDLEKPEETLMLMERLVEVQQLYSQLSKQAEQRTTLISKVREHSAAPPGIPSSLNLSIPLILTPGHSDRFALCMLLPFISDDCNSRYCRYCWEISEKSAREGSSCSRMQLFNKESIV